MIEEFIKRRFLWGGGAVMGKKAAAWMAAVILIFMVTGCGGPYQPGEGEDETQEGFMLLSELFEEEAEGCRGDGNEVLHERPGILDGKWIHGMDGMGNGRAG
jgi:hypothetical protein